MENEELKSCPFCGGKGLLQVHTGNPMTTGWFHSVECQSCYGGTFHYADTKEKAIEAWNTRKTKTENKCTHVVKSQTSASGYLCTICGKKYKPEGQFQGLSVEEIQDVINSVTGNHGEKVYSEYSLCR